MLSPRPVAGRLVVDASQEIKDFGLNLVGRDTKLLIELALGGALDAGDRIRERSACLSGDLERVRAAGVGPHAYAVSDVALWRGILKVQTSECDLLVGALL